MLPIDNAKLNFRSILNSNLKKQRKIKNCKDNEFCVSKN